MLAVFTFIFVMMLMFEFASRMVYGKLLTDQQVMDHLMTFEPFELNPFNESIMSPKIKFDDDYDLTKMTDRIKNGKFISIMSMTLSSKYYISGLGRVQRWSRGHYMIQRLYNDLNQK